jgi:serpin B
MLPGSRTAFVFAVVLLAVAGIFGRGARAAGPDLSRASNQLGFDLYRSLKAQPGNLTFSPASIFIALTMPWSGARGATARQMAGTLHLTATPDAVAPAAGALLRSLNQPARSAYTLRVANRLFLEKSYPLEKPYLAQMAAFDAPAEPVDFRGAPEPARVHINQWVAQQTSNRIRDLVPPRAVDDQTRLALVNAIYLLADWGQPFEAERTRPLPFHAAGRTHDVPTMQQVESFGYAEAPGLQVLEMRYQGDELAMDVILPTARDGLAALEQQMDATRVARWLAALKPERVLVALPKFTIDPPASIALAEELKALGMADAFDRERADFTGIANPPRAADRLYVSQVFHKAFVKVDEKGTEAAAATAVMMARAGAAPSARPKEFRADHPFLFLIRDLRSGLILFLGRVADPN